MKGWPALYLAADHVTAVAEYYRGLPRPGTLVPYSLDATRIADLTRTDDHVGGGTGVRLEGARANRGQGAGELGNGFLTPAPPMAAAARTPRPGDR